MLGIYLAYSRIDTTSNSDPDYVATPLSGSGGKPIINNDNGDHNIVSPSIDSESESYGGVDTEKKRIMMDGEAYPGRRFFIAGN